MAKVRLHRQHDMDLISLYRIDSSYFQTELKKTLIAYVKNNAVTYKIARPDGEIRTGYVPKSVQFNIRLSEKKEDEARVIRFLDSIKSGQRNAFLKALFRSSLEFIPLSSYQIGDGLLMTKSEYELSKDVDVDEENNIETKEYKKDITMDKGVSDSFKTEIKEVPAPIFNKNSDKTSTKDNEVRENTVNEVKSMGTEGQLEENEMDDLFASMMNLSYNE